MNDLELGMRVTAEALPGKKKRLSDLLDPTNQEFRAQIAAKRNAQAEARARWTEKSEKPSDIPEEARFEWELQREAIGVIEAGLTAGERLSDEALRAKTSAFRARIAERVKERTTEFDARLDDLSEQLKKIEESATPESRDELKTN